MFSGNEWIIVAIVALVLFGGSQLPKLARNVGQAQKEFKKGLAEGHEDDDEPTDSQPTRRRRPEPAGSDLEKSSIDVRHTNRVTGPAPVGRW